MSLKHLKRVEQPKPVEIEACAACEAFKAECLVPIEEEAIPMCWLCAHHVIEHDCLPHKAMTAECECSPRTIYPDASLMTPARQAEFDAALSARRGRC